MELAHHVSHGISAWAAHLRGVDNWLVVDVEIDWL